LAAFAVISQAGEQCYQLRLQMRLRLDEHGFQLHACRLLGDAQDGGGVINASAICELLRQPRTCCGQLKAVRSFFSEATGRASRSVNSMSAVRL